jgi:ureidoglycolate lyase
MMERHPFSSQTFVPISASRFLIMVSRSLSDGQPNLRTIEAFVGQSEQGFTYRPGVWHQGVTALDKPATFAVLMWQDGGTCDEVFVSMPEPITIALNQLSGPV